MMDENEYFNQQDQFASNLVNLRQARSITQSQLSKLSGIPRSTLANFESGSGNPSLLNLSKLAASLNVKIEDLLSPPVTKAKFIKSKQLPSSNKANGVLVINMVPIPVKGLKIEKMVFEGHSNFIGTPHLKGTKEYFTCIKGRCQIVVSGHKYDLLTGDILIFSGDEKHSYHNPNGQQTIGLSVIIGDDPL